MIILSVFYRDLLVLTTDGKHIYRHQCLFSSTLPVSDEGLHHTTHFTLLTKPLKFKSLTVVLEWL